MKVPVIVGLQAGKIVLSGTTSAAQIVNHLRNGLITVNANAQRSLMKGALKESTRELIDGDRVHAMPRMKEITKFFNRVMRNLTEGNRNEGFFGAVQLIVPQEFGGARLDEVNVSDQEKSRNYSLGAFVDTLRSNGLRAGTLTLESALGIPGIHIGDGQGRIVGLHSMERKVQNAIDEIKKKIRRAEKALHPAAELKVQLGELETTLKQIRQFVSHTTLPFVMYVSEVKPDGTIVGLSSDAEKRLYIEGNALNARAAQEEVLKFEAFSPVIVLLQEIRMDERFLWMNLDNVEEESKSIGITSSRIFTLSTLVQAFSRSIVHHTKPIKFAEEDLDLVGEREAFVTAYWAKISEVFGPIWMRHSESAIGDRVTYLKDRRAEQHVAFTAIFLQALGELGYRLGELAEWDPDSRYLGVIEALSPRGGLNYIARSMNGEYEPVWQNAMMKPAGDGDRWVFNNVSDSVTKTYRALCEAAGIPATHSEDVEASEEEYQEVE